MISLRGYPIPDACNTSLEKCKPLRLKFSKGKFVPDPNSYRKMIWHLIQEVFLPYVKEFELKCHNNLAMIAKLVELSPDLHNCLFSVIAGTSSTTRPALAFNQLIEGLITQPLLTCYYLLNWSTLSWQLREICFDKTHFILRINCQEWTYQLRT